MGLTKVDSDGVEDNPSFSGTGGMKIPVGNTSQRVDTTGLVRFNSQTGLLEYYDGTTYKGLDTPPVVSSVNTSNFESSALPTNVVITGSNFASSVSVKFIGADGTETASGSVTRDSVTQVTAQIPNTITSDNEPYKIQVTNTTSALSGTLANAFNIDAAPAFGVASGSLGTLGSYGAASGLTTITATDDEGDSITFSVSSGSVPGGLTLNSNGTWSGNANAVTSSTTTTFTVQASDGTNTSTRQYSITVNPVFVQLSGSGTWTVPSGVLAAEILIVAGGASGSRSPNVSGGGGGGGGIVHRSSYTFTATDKSSGIAYVVGAGGNGVGISPEAYDGGYNNGADSTFALSGGTITAKGGGGGAGYGGNTHKPGFGSSYYAPSQGGSGGGGAWESGTGASSNQADFTGWTSYGNSGGNRASGENYAGAGGGGAGGAGSNSTATVGGNGGAGQLFSSFTSYGASGYFGGGGAGGSQSDTVPQGGSGGGGNGGYGSGATNRSGANATDGTGGGGGGSRNLGYGTFTYKSGDGGNGTILIKY